MAGPFHLRPLDFSLTNPTDLSAEEICLATFHPGATDSFLASLYKHWNRRRESLRSSGMSIENGGIAGLPIDFPLDDLNSLSSEELAIVASGFHLDADEDDKETLKAQRLFSKRRERDLAKGERAKTPVPLANRPMVESVVEKVVPAVSTPIIQRNHAVSIKATAKTPPPITFITPPTDATIVPPTLVSAPAPAIRPPILPNAIQLTCTVPDGTDPLPSSLFHLVHTLRLSNLPISVIKNESDLYERLEFQLPEILRPVAIKFLPVKNELSAIAYVAYHDFETMTVANQAMIGWMIERWNISISIDLDSNFLAQWVWEDFNDKWFVLGHLMADLIAREGKEVENNVLVETVMEKPVEVVVKVSAPPPLSSPTVKKLPPTPAKVPPIAPKVRETEVSKPDCVPNNPTLPTVAVKLHPKPVIPPATTPTVRESISTDQGLLSKNEVGGFYHLAVSFKSLPRIFRQSIDRVAYITNILPNDLIAIKAGPDRLNYITYLAFPSVITRNTAWNILTRHNWGQYASGPIISALHHSSVNVGWTRADKVLSSRHQKEMEMKEKARNLVAQRQSSKEGSSGEKTISTLPAPIQFLPASNLSHSPQPASIPTVQSNQDHSRPSSQIKPNQFASQKNGIPPNPTSQKNLPLASNTVSYSNNSKRVWLPDMFVSNAPGPSTATLYRQAMFASSSNNYAPTSSNHPRLKSKNESKSLTFDIDTDEAGNELPKGWIRGESSRGGYYYWHEGQQESTWNSPAPKLSKSITPQPITPKPQSPLKGTVNDVKLANIAAEQKRLEVEKKRLEKIAEGKRLDEELELQRLERIRAEQRRAEEELLAQEQRLEQERKEKAESDRIEFDRIANTRLNVQIQAPARIRKPSPGLDEFEAERSDLALVAAQKLKVAMEKARIEKESSAKRQIQLEMEDRALELARTEDRRVAHQEMMEVENALIPNRKKISRTTQNQGKISVSNGNGDAMEQLETSLSLVDRLALPLNHRITTSTSSHQVEFLSDRMDPQFSSPRKIVPNLNGGRNKFNGTAQQHQQQQYNCQNGKRKIDGEGDGKKKFKGNGNGSNNLCDRIG